MSELRMDAYYFGFDKTDEPSIDLILSAVACAGKAFHGTEQWNDQTSPYTGHSGNSPTEWIQNAAVSATEHIRELQAQLARSEARAAELEEEILKIGDFAHDKSTGPAVPDALWEIRSMAYGLFTHG